MAEAPGVCTDIERDFVIAGDDQVLKVASGSNAHSLAGAIAKRMREGGGVKMVGIGPQSVNQAVKALAISRTYLEEDGIDLTVRPEFIHIPGRDATQPQRSALRFNITSRPLPPNTRGGARNQQPSVDDGTVQLKVAHNSTPSLTAGAIAKRVREGKRCVVVAMGAESVNQAVKSIAIARTYLEDDMLDINFKPKFIHLELAGAAPPGRDQDKKSAVEMTIMMNPL